MESPVLSEVVGGGLTTVISHRHSMSQDSTDSVGSGSSSVVNVPPTHSRLPPDGDEFPPDYRDPSAAGTDGQVG